MIFTPTFTQLSVCRAEVTKAEITTVVDCNHNEIQQTLQRLLSNLLSLRKWTSAIAFGRFWRRLCDTQCIVGSSSSSSSVRQSVSSAATLSLHQHIQSYHRFQKPVGSSHFHMTLYRYIGINNLLVVRCPRNQFRQYSGKSDPIKEIRTHWT